MTYPTIMPAITLDFANSQQLDPRVTFSRASGATYTNSSGLIASAADHEPRFDHDPVTGECLGLLIEESRTNFIVNSEYLESSTGWKSVWDGATVTRTRDVTIANPSGGTGASKIEVSRPTAENDWGAVGANSVNTGSSGVKTVFVWLKAATASDVGKKVSLWQYDSGFKIYRNIVLTDGWVRVNATSSSYGASVSEPLNLGLLQSSVPDSDGVTNTELSVNFYAWGAQLEEEFPTSYIPTAGSAVTRAADIARIDGSNFTSWFNQDAGSFVATVDPGSKGGPVVGPIANGTDVSAALFLQCYASQIRVINYLGPGATGNDLVDNSPVDGVNTFAVAGSKTESGTVARFNGSLGTVNANRAQGQTSLFGIKIGERSGNYYCGHLSRLSYYNERLTDAELQTLTS